MQKPRVSPESLRMREKFTKNDVATRKLIQKGYEYLEKYENATSCSIKVKDSKENDKEGETVDYQVYEDELNDLFLTVRSNINEMKDISEDLAAIQTQKASSPRIIDQAKTFALTVQGLQASLRKLQMEFQSVQVKKHRTDLFSLCKSPFEENRSIRRRGNKAAEISSNTTRSLTNSRQILLETVQRSAGTLEHLYASSQAIETNQDELKEQSSVLSIAEKLLGKYGRRESTDKMLIWVGLAFFFAVVFYVVQKRLF